MKRLFNLVLVLGVSVLLVLPVLVVIAMVKLTSKGPVLYWSDRVGQNGKLFKMPKFRSMKVDTPALATHLMNEQVNEMQYLTSVGGLLRKASLDEIPQLWSVLKGDMSIVGPRPALFNQDDLIALRVEYGVHKLKPGITGWAQVNGRDEITISQKVELDTYYLKHQSFWLDCHIVFLTALKVLERNDVSH